MGTLYRAHKDSLDVDVVIKRVKQKFKGRMDERAEANILKTLKHKYLPRIYDVIESPSGYVYTIIAMLQYQLHDFSKAMEMLQALKKDYPKDYRVYKWLAFVQGELDLQNGASYTKTLGYYETAAELYRAEQASGVYDPQMDELDRMARNNWQ